MTISLALDELCKTESAVHLTGNYCAPATPAHIAVSTSEGGGMTQ